MDSFIQEKAPVGALYLIVKLQTSRRILSSSTWQHLGATIILVWVIAIIVRTEIEIVEGRAAPAPRPTNNFLVVMIIGRSTDGALLPRSVLLSDYQISNSCFVTRIGYTHIHSYRSILYGNKMFSVSTWKVVDMYVLWYPFPCCTNNHKKSCFIWTKHNELFGRGDNEQL